LADKEKQKTRQQKQFQDFTNALQDLDKALQNLKKLGCVKFVQSWLAIAEEQLKKFLCTFIVYT